MSKYTQLFTKASHAADYAKYRPVYTTALFAELAKQATSGHQLCVDVACGSGQLTFGLSKHFDRVIGTDISAAQVDAAQKKATGDYTNVHFEVADANQIPCADNSVDLVTIAQAAHWLDLSVYYKECDRVLKKNGCLAVIGYGNMILEHKECQRIITEEFYDGLLKNYWESARRLIDDEYRTLMPPPYADTYRWESVITKQITVAGLIGYLRSWSALQTYHDRNPDAPDPLVPLAEKLLSSLGHNATPDTEISATWPLFALIAHK